MNIRSARFLASATSLESCPPAELPEFAFIGRSNVGKSSLLNMLARKKDLAKVSATAGKTKLINFFTINDVWNIVDLPGYGYAAGSKQDRFKFQRMITDYLLGRENLRQVFVLIDSRHSPQPIDVDFVAWSLESGVPFRLVFTKADKMKAGPMKKNIAAFLGNFTDGASWPVVSCSSKTGDGRLELLRVMGDQAAKVEGE
ncbi:ribosome biogenesis GTP-binding protein YihA/YsxC [Luteolibacter marinus]|uniref:ribosome biogenesis GTP-binding protein YihA/YsxC n=1 Tax=Luteolibacter marinus TaxID=2776705 RepID=UPI0018675C25|nr:ribosome biogenesis GTP-binding protein YihA/YsxC [Luteolibacter marinus]